MTEPSLPLTLPLVFVNDEQQSTISITDRGLAYGDGVFETILVINGSMPLWEYHRDRLLLGLKALGIALEPESLNRHLVMVMSAMKSLSEASLVFKLMVTRGNGGRGYQAPETQSPNLISQVLPLPVSSVADVGASLHLCQLRLPEMPHLSGLKTLSQIHYVLASQERLGTGYDEGLLLSTNNYLIEATARNVFLAFDNRLLTPVLDTCGVPGVMRRFLIEQLAHKFDIEVEQTQLTLEDLAEADEVFLSNSVTGIWPVTQCTLEGSKKMSWPIGPITKCLQGSLNNWLHNSSDLTASSTK